MGEVQVVQTQRALEQAMVQQATVIQETALVQQSQQHEQTNLADALVRELYTVSQSLGELYQLRQDHLELSQNYDALVAKLLLAEERIQLMQEGGGSSSNSSTRGDGNGVNDKNNGADDNNNGPEQGGGDVSLLVPNFKELEGHLLIMVKVLYRTRTLGTR